MSQLDAHNANLQFNFTLRKDDDHDFYDHEKQTPPPEPAAPTLFGLPLKYISLVTLAVQNSALALIMHYSRVSTPASRAYSAATAVLMNELLKGAISLAIAFARIEPYPGHAYEPVSSGWSPRLWFLRVSRLRKEVFSADCWKLSIPAILYVIQNNLQFVAASNLEAATFQVSYQMKILTTAAFSVLLLRKKLSASQWLALVCLAIGVGIVQIQTSPTSPVKAVLGHGHDSMNPLKGFLAVVAACFTSGLAGVYFEMVLKGSQADLWVRNVQLSTFSLLPALVPVVFAHRHGGAVPGDLFRNFGAWAWGTVLVQVFGGLLTALVIKYSDNILKGFATSLSIVMSFMASVALFDFQMTFTFILGSVIVLIATGLYNQPGKPAPSASGREGKGWSFSLANKAKPNTSRSGLHAHEFDGVAITSSARSLSSSSLSVVSASGDDRGVETDGERAALLEKSPGL